MKKIKRNTHLVVKWEWLEESLNDEELETLYGLLDKATENKPEYRYIICNADESFAQRVYDIILNNEPAISKDQTLLALNECRDLDPELAHAEAEELLLKYINDKEIAKAFENVPKWFSDISDS